jgi:hypothetical protein
MGLIRAIASSTIKVELLLDGVNNVFYSVKKEFSLKPMVALI